MKIPRIYKEHDADRNQPRAYRVELLNILTFLKPKFCLEIGSHYLQSSHIFSEYFTKSCPDGWLITCDIKKYVACTPEHNISQVKVYPHINNICNIHNVEKGQMLQDALSENRLKHSVENNIFILQSSMGPLGIDSFDFCFLDGDHTEISFRKDLEIALTLTTKPHYILIDDIDESNHDCSKIYHNEIKGKFNHYEIAGMGLIWK